MDGASLLLSCHGACLRSISEALGEHSAGLATAVRKARLSGPLRRRLLRLDTAAAVIRHITAPSVTDLQRDLDVALAPLRDLHAASLSATDSSGSDGVGDISLSQSELLESESACANSQAKPSCDSIGIQTEAHANNTLFVPYDKPSFSDWLADVLCGDEELRYTFDNTYNLRTEAVQELGTAGMFEDGGNPEKATTSDDCSGKADVAVQATPSLIRRARRGRVNGRAVQTDFVGSAEMDAVTCHKGDDPAHNLPPAVTVLRHAHAARVNVLYIRVQVLREMVFLAGMLWEEHDIWTDSRLLGFWKIEMDSLGAKSMGCRDRSDDGMFALGELGGLLDISVLNRRERQSEQSRKVVALESS